METSDFVDQDDIESAPAEDTDAFTHYAVRASEKFSSRIANYRGDQEDWENLNEARFGFHNYILAIGSIYGVSPFDDVPFIDFENYANKEWRAFKSQYDRRMATLIHSKARASRSDGFLLTETTKEGIRTHLAGLRKYINESQLPVKDKKKLLGKVDEFEKSLAGRRMNMNAVYLFAGFMLSHAADLTTVIDSDIVHKLVGGVVAVANEATARTEEVVALMAPKTPLQITGPKPASVAPSRAQPMMSPIPERGPRESFSADLDDEIPF